MDSLTSGNASVPDKSFKSNNENTNISDPDKLLREYFAARRENDTGVTQIILETLLSGIINSEMVMFYGILDPIMSFDSKTSELNNNTMQQISAGIKRIQGKEITKFLSKKRIDCLPKLENGFKEASFKYNKLQGEVEKFKYKDVPRIINEIQTLQEKGLFSYAVLDKSVKFFEEGIQLSYDRKEIMKQMGILRDAIDDLIVYANDTEYRPENDYMKVLIDCNLEKGHHESKKNICRSEHKTPFCKNCGWKTSWLKNFKKRGVYVKEDANSTSEHIWNINVNTE